MKPRVTREAIEAYREEIDFKSLPRTGAQLAPEEKAFLLENYSKLGPTICAEIWNRSPESVSRFGAKMGLKYSYPPTILQKRVATLREQGFTVTQIQERLGVSRNTVYNNQPRRPAVSV